jgi:hypothetical protein
MLCQLLSFGFLLLYQPFQVFPDLPGTLGDAVT